MDYFFTIESKLNGINIEKAKQLFQERQFHENICQKIPGSHLDIQRSEQIGQRYYLERAYNLELDMPDLVRKLLKDAFRLQRNDHWDFNHLRANSTLKSNLPGHISFETLLSEEQETIKIRQHWKLDIPVPLIHKTLAKFAETEIRKFHDIEVSIIQQELLNQEKV